MPNKTESEAVEELQHRLAAKFSAVGQADIAAVLEQARIRFADSKIRDFVPLLVERRVTSELARIAARQVADERSLLAG